MHRFLTTSMLALALVVGFHSVASAQVVRVWYPPPPLVVPAPAPVVTSYYTPVYSYYPPVTTTVYSSPVPTVFPSTTVFSSPVTPVYTAPAYVPGIYTTRSYVGLGIFRPRGVYTQSFYTPGYAAPVTTYYRWWP